jgi:putative hydrolase of the HAD superfamily
MNEYRAAKLQDLEAVTFDHFNTLQYSPRKREDDTLQSIIRALSSRVAIDADTFAAKYREIESHYQHDLEETKCETLMDDLILIALHESGHDADGMVEEVAESVDRVLDKYGLLWVQGAEETLRSLRDAGFKIGLISNTHWRWLPEKWEEMGRYFDVVTLSYVHGFAKPHPSIFKATLDRLGVSPGKCLHVGDDPIADVWGARQVGMKTAHVNLFGTECDSDVSLHQIGELLQLLS